jgi:hypothetical protein
MTYQYTTAWAMCPITQQTLNDLQRILDKMGQDGWRVHTVTALSNCLIYTLERVTPAQDAKAP